MRVIAILVVASASSSCTATLTTEPRLQVSPYYAVYELRGKVNVSTDPGGGAPLQTNPPQEMSLFGQDHHEDDVGIRVEFGDGFAGLRADYYRLDMTTSQNGILPADWGALLSGDVMRMNADMDELRLSWVEPLTQIDTTWRDEDLTIRFAGGGEFAYRDLNLRAQTDDTVRRQNISISGETISLAARARAEWRDFTLDVDYAISPDFTVSGDYTGVNQDLELRGSYEIPGRDVTFFAGYRYSTLEADGNAGMVPYSTELEIDGFQFGMMISL